MLTNMVASNLMKCGSRDVAGAKEELNLNFLKISIPHLFSLLSTLESAALNSFRKALMLPEAQGPVRSGRYGRSRGRPPSESSAFKIHILLLC